MVSPQETPSSYVHEMSLPALLHIVRLKISAKKKLERLSD